MACSPAEQRDIQVLYRTASACRCAHAGYSLSDDELAACCGLGGDWDNCYIGVLAAIAATPIAPPAPLSRPQPRQLQFSFIGPEL